jgi:Fe-S cluster assembly protein SufD
MEKQYIELYKAHHQLIKQNSAAVINRSRDAAFAKFESLGFPTIKHENYLYTDLKPVFSPDYGLNFRRLSFPVNPYQTFRCDVPEIYSYQFFVVNDGFYPPKEEHNGNLPKGVIICGLKEASEKHPELVAQYYGKLTAPQNDALVAFNETFAQDGFFMYVPENVHMDKPVQLVNIMRSDVDLLANSRNLIIIEKGAKAQLLVCDHAMDDVNFVANRVSEVFVGENAVYENYKLENTHDKTANLATVLIDQKESSDTLMNIITLNNGISRNNIEVAMNGEKCEAELCGMMIGGGQQQIDNHTTIMHNKPNCHSNELFKYVLDDVSKGAFTGRIFVEKDAQQTRAYQLNRNILLSKRAKVRTRPQLEIYADDVKCSHGATIGQIDEQALFYMRTRGISLPEARLLLMYAFAADVIENIRIPSLANRMKMLVEKRMRGELGMHEGCTLCMH